MTLELAVTTARSSRHSRYSSTFRVRFVWISSTTANGFMSAAVVSLSRVTYQGEVFQAACHDGRVELHKTDFVSGLPAEAVVRFLRYFSREGGGIVASHKPALLADEFGSDEDALVRLAADGYVEHIEDTQWGPMWQTTVAGNAIANHRWTKPVMRKTAERLLIEATQRAALFNDCSSRAMVIARLRVFGSYLDPARDGLGDVDLAFDLRERRQLSRSEAIAYASEARVLYIDGFDHHAWLRAEAMRFVKGRSRAISPTPENPAELGSKWSDVYTFHDLNQLPAFAHQGDKDFGW